MGIFFFPEPREKAQKKRKNFFWKKKTFVSVDTMNEFWGEPYGARYHHTDNDIINQFQTSPLGFQKPTEDVDLGLGGLHGFYQEPPMSPEQQQENQHLVDSILGDSQAHQIDNYELDISEIASIMEDPTGLDEDFKKKKAGATQKTNIHDVMANTVDSPGSPGYSGKCAHIGKMQKAHHHRHEPYGRRQYTAAEPEINFDQDEVCHEPIEYIEEPVVEKEAFLDMQYLQGMHHTADQTALLPQTPSPSEYES